MCSLGRLAKSPTPDDYLKVRQMGMKQQPQNEAAVKKPYDPPRLVVYGDVRRLTQSGSQNGRESINKPQKGGNKP